MIYVQFILNFFPVKTREIQDGKTCQMCGRGVAFNSCFFFDWFDSKLQKYVINMLL